MAIDGLGCDFVLFVPYHCFDDIWSIGLGRDI